MNSQVEKVNALLREGEPQNITKPDTNGYVGYEPQAIIDALNEVLWGAWGFEEISTEIVAGEKGPLAVAQVRVWLKDVDFRPVAWGQGRETRGDTGDAKKSAQTDAIKKALSYFSIGNRAYHGLLPKPKDSQAQQRPVAVPPRQNTSSPTQPVSRPSQSVTEASAEEIKKQIDTVQSLLAAHYQIPMVNQPAKWKKFKELVLGLPVEDEGLDLAEVKRLREAIDAKINQAKAS